MVIDARRDFISKSVPYLMPTVVDVNHIWCLLYLMLTKAYHIWCLPYLITIFEPSHFMECLKNLKYLLRGSNPHPEIVWALLILLCQFAEINECLYYMIYILLTIFGPSQFKGNSIWNTPRFCFNFFHNVRVHKNYLVDLELIFLNTWDSFPNFYQMGGASTSGTHRKTRYLLCSLV